VWPSVFAGYLNDDDATARVFAGEWLRTGDIIIVTAAASTGSWTA
jgi:fatty-acyl-CoA synthase